MGVILALINFMVERLPNVCPNCGSAPTSAEFQTRYIAYYACRGCATAWTVPLMKPQPRLNSTPERRKPPRKSLPSDDD
jgi:hypothetical protein